MHEGFAEDHLETAVIVEDARKEIPAQLAAKELTGPRARKCFRSLISPFLTHHRFDAWLLWHVSINRI